MKKIRSCPFGYQMENGKYKIISEEGGLVQELFNRYLDGASLKELASIAEQTGLKFRGNATCWNKNMISRMLDDERYWNEKGFPSIINQKIAAQVASLKRSKSLPKSAIPFIQKRMTCSKCGAVLQRNSKKTPKIYWDCKGCCVRFGPLANDELLYTVTAKFLAVCQEPQMPEPNQQPGDSLSIQAARLTNEINQMLDQREVDPNRLLPLILECAAEKYKTCRIRESDHLTIKIKALFQEHGYDEKLDRELFEQTVKQVILQPDGSVQLRLLNNKIII